MVEYMEIVVIFAIKVLRRDGRGDKWMVEWIKEWKINKYESTILDTFF